MAGSTIATAYVQVVPSAKGIKGSLTNAFSAEGNSAGSSFGSSLISKVKGMMAAAGIGKMLGDSLMKGANLQQSLGGIETLFKDSADTVIQNAEQAYKTAGMSANSYMEMVTGFSASLLQGLGGDTEKAASVADMALSDMSDNANKMGTNMELIQNAYQGFAKQNYTMLDNLKLGYGGTRTEMQRLLTDAEKLTGIHYDIDNLSDVYSAIHAIQEEMGITGTTALEASTTIIGSYNAMKASFSDVLANLALGREIGPSLNALSETTVTFLKDNLSPAVLNIVKALPGAAVTFIKGVLPSNMKDVVSTTVNKFSEFITINLPQILEEGENMVASMVEGFTAAAPDFLESVQSLLSESLTAIIGALPNLLSSGANIAESLINGFKQNAPVFLQNAGQLMVDLLAAIMAALPDMLSSGASLVGNLVSGFVSCIPDVLVAAAELLAELLATLAAGLPDMLEQGISLIGEVAAGMINAIPTAVAAIPDLLSSIGSAFWNFDWGGIGSDIVSGIAEGIKNSVDIIGSAAKFLGSFTENAMKDATEIHSPSRLMAREVGAPITAGIAVGMKNNTKLIHDAAGDVADVTTEALGANLSMDSFGSVSANTGTSGRIINNTIYVYGAEGQSMEELAEILLEKMQIETEKKEVVFA